MNIAPGDDRFHHVQHTVDFLERLQNLNFWLIRMNCDRLLKGKKGGGDQETIKMICVKIRTKSLGTSIFLQTTFIAVFCDWKGSVSSSRNLTPKRTVTRYLVPCSTSDSVVERIFFFFCKARLRQSDVFFEKRSVPFATGQELE